ncbi:hypothetical protein PsYK624_167620 [Phanerochaete sordida]|uniref:Uncharacterized protein n=1 Tax=Phanerochaete sordida TaxID=48140 RepID=A0A9P3GRF6_9APHY|nr:hypothetical protein PsYK624_167620 [Phanerochaete sordida]
MFVPENNHYNSTLLAPLSVWATPIVEYLEESKSKRKTYGLSADAVKEWHKLEDCLHHCQHVLTCWGRMLFPTDIVQPRSPSSYRFDARFATHRDAKRAIGLARAAFLPLAAIVSYFICRLDHDIPAFERSFDDHGNQTVCWHSMSWRCRLPELGVMHPTTVDLLSSSWVGDPSWSQRRVGAFVDLTSSDSVQWLHDYRSIKRVAAESLPIWLFYGDRPEKCTTERIAQDIYLPLRAQVEVALCQRELSIFLLHSDSIRPEGPSSQSTADGPQPPALAPDVPEPESGSRQHSGEDIWEFLKRDANQTSQKMMNESDGVRQRRQHREQAEREKTYPTLKGPRVYHWVRTQGYWIRRRVEPMKYRALWDATQPDHRRYNSVTNEWDVSLLLGPGEVDSSYEGWDAEVTLSTSSARFEEDFGDDEDVATIGLDVADGRSRSRSNTVGVRDRIRSQSPRHSQHGLHATSLRSPEHDLTGCVALVPEASVVNKDIYSDVTAPVEELLPALAARYGFKPTITPPSSSPTDRGLIRALRILAELPREMASTPRMRSIPDFVTALSNSASNETALAPSDPPCDFWDLTPGSIHHDELRSAVGAIALRVVDAEGDTLYFIAYAASASWCLAVMTAIDAVEIARRRWGPKAEDIVHELVARGISFRILWPLGAAPPPARPAPTLRPIGGWVGLGYRDATYKPVGMDYQLYIDRRRAIINGPRAAAALAKGGIVWRLVYEELEPGESLLERHYSDQNTVLRVGENAYETCAISDEELNCICGVYRIYAGISYRPDWF